jgi:oligopeptide/dipeptide ABC transporter ATP-binding protein
MADIILEPAETASTHAGPVLEIDDLTVTFATEEGPVQAVRGVDLYVNDHEVLGIVGESGSGKSVTMLAIMGLLPNTATITGSARFRGQELLGRDAAPSAGRLRGGKMAMIFQDPLTALNPVHRVGDQIAEAIEAHHPDWTSKQVDSRALEMLELVGIPQPDARAKQYPHEFSGGMRQRAMIAMAISNDPALLIADEPTTALDVTVQAQILEVIKEAQLQVDAAVVFITHDLGVIARLASRVQVMYAGRTAEVAPVDTIFQASRHPYTRGLLGSLPKLDEVEREQLHPIQGAPPSMLNPPPACAFHPRCAMAQPRCAVDVPPLHIAGVDGQVSACHYAEDLAGVESPTELPQEIVERAPDKEELFEVAAEALPEAPPRRLLLGAVIGFVLGVAAPVVALLARDAAVFVRGLLVMGLGIPAVLLTRSALREIRAHLAVSKEGVPRGRILAKIGSGLAWMSITIWVAYCILWLLAEALPEAQP